MNVEIKCICRGDGKVYIDMAVDTRTNDSVLTMSARTTEGLPVPSQLVTANDGNVRSFTAVIPLLRTGMELQLFENDANGAAIDTWKKVFTPPHLKWASRYNYRFNASAANAIRDIETREFYSRGRLSIEECLVSAGGDILRGTFTAPLNERSRISFTLFNGMGEEIPCKAVITSEHVRPSSDARHSDIVRRDFSLRLPEGSDSFGVVTHDDTGFLQDGFLWLEEKAYQQMRVENARKMGDTTTAQEYDAWFRATRAKPAVLERQRRNAPQDGPLFSIIVPLYKTPVKLFTEMVRSVLAQSYAGYELVLVNSTPEDERLSTAVAKAQSRDHRIRVVELESNLGITENTNKGIEVARGDFICFFDHDDLIEPDTLFEYVRAVEEHPDADMLYCDEDKLDENGHFFHARFKPDFNIDLLRTNNYICHFLCIRTSIISSLTPPTAKYDGAQDYNMILRTAEHARYVHHVPKILYHWRLSKNSTAGDAGTKPYADQAGLIALQEHLDRLGLDATAENTEWNFVYRVRYHVKGRPLVSIIMPNKDNVAVLRACLESIFEKSTYRDFEIIIMENGSVEQATFDYYAALQEAHDNIRIESFDAPFDFSQICNKGAQSAHGEYLLFMNNDMKVITDDFLENMLGYCQRDDVGAVGAKLLYPDDTIQHAGLAIAGTGVLRLYRSIPDSFLGYCGALVMAGDYSAVTAACMMTPHALFDDLGGFSEDFRVAFNDVDYCLRVRDAGYLVVYTPEAQLYHYESLTRGIDTDRNDGIRLARFVKEIALFHERWARYYVLCDPYFNPNLDPDNDYYHLRPIAQPKAMAL